MLQSTQSVQVLCLAEVAINLRFPRTVPKSCAQVVPPRFVRTSPTFVYTPPKPSAGNLPFESPINITGRATNLSKYLTITYHDTEDGQATITSKDVVVEAPSSNSDSIDVDGQKFGLVQFHFHATSENHVDSRAYSMEEHFVNKNAAGRNRCPAYS